MIVNFFLQFFGCWLRIDGHEILMDLGDPNSAPTEKDIGQHGTCKHCFAVFEIG